MEEDGMKISVVMCTFNGENYVINQLSSILAQTRQPDEVIIVDDVSTDNTVSVVQKFLTQNGLEMNWKLYQNEKNKGWQKNFSDSFFLTSGDIIFCCDQDDEWYANKIGDMEEAFELRPNMLLLGGYVKAVDDNNELIRKRIGSFPISNETGEITHVRFDENFFLTRQPGCAIAFRKELLDLYKKYWYDLYPHDQLLWNLAVLLDGAFLLDETVLKYNRISSSVFMSEGKRRSSQRRLGKIYKLEKVIRNIKMSATELRCDERKISVISAGEQWIKQRKELIENKRIINLFLLLENIKFYPYKILYLVDFYDMFQIKRRRYGFKSVESKD